MPIEGVSVSAISDQTQKGLEKTNQLKILLVEDNPADADRIVRELRRDGFVITAEIVHSPDQFRQQLRDTPPDLVLSDYNLKDWGGLNALEILKEMALEIPSILVSGSLGEIAAVECIKLGVTDYILKNALGLLPVSILRALREQALRTQKKNAEAELARSNRDLEQFASIASHDLQESLRMVATYTELLSERLGPLDDQTSEYIRYIVDGAERMQTLIHDLLGFSRIGNNGTELKATDCYPLLETALLANGPQLQQVFQNLIGNAIKFHGSESPAIKISAEQKNTEWIFATSDNGIGIAAEEAKTVFVMFQRLHNREEYAGNGIGLAICKKVIERQGGRIWLESQPQEGTTLEFALRGAQANTLLISRICLSTHGHHCHRLKAGPTGIGGHAKVKGKAARISPVGKRSVRIGVSRRPRTTIIDRMTS
jgi:signal transduction histidine kinase